MRTYTQQSSRFAATPAQIKYLRAIHQGLSVNTNWATRNRCYRFLVFGEHGEIWVKPEIVAQFNLDEVQNPPAPEPVDEAPGFDALNKAVAQLKASQDARYGGTTVTVDDLTNLQLAAYLGCASALTPADVLTDKELAAYQPKIVLDAITNALQKPSHEAWIAQEQQPLEHSGDGAWIGSKAHQHAVAQFPMVCVWTRDAKSKVEVLWQADPPAKHAPLDFNDAAFWGANR